MKIKTHPANTRLPRATWGTIVNLIEFKTENLKQFLEDSHVEYVVTSKKKDVSVSIALLSHNENNILRKASKNKFYIYNAHASFHVDNEPDFITKAQYILAIKKALVELLPELKIPQNERLDVKIQDQIITIIRLPYNMPNQLFTDYYEQKFVPNQQLTQQIQDFLNKPNPYL